MLNVLDRLSPPDEETRGVLKVFLENVIRDAVTYTEHARYAWLRSALRPLRGYPNTEDPMFVSRSEQSQDGHGESMTNSQTYQWC